MVYINMVFSLGHFWRETWKLCHFGQLPGKSLRLWQDKDLSNDFLLNESLFNKLYEYEAIFEQLFSEKKLFESAFYKLQNGTYFNNFWKSHGNSLLREPYPKNAQCIIVWRKSGANMPMLFAFFFFKHISICIYIGSMSITQLYIGSTHINDKKNNWSS